MLLSGRSLGEKGVSFLSGVVLGWPVFVILPTNFRFETESVEGVSEDMCSGGAEERRGSERVSAYIQGPWTSTWGS